MNEEASFLSAIRENPADETARLVYADWLDEQGTAPQAAKAAFIRLELRMATPPEDGLHRVRLLTQIRKAAASLDHDWLLVVSHPRLEACQLQFKFDCPKQWGGLQPTADPKKRFCGACRLHVHYCDTIEEAQNHTANGHCIAVSLGVSRRAFDTRPPRPGPPKVIADRRGKVPLWVSRATDVVEVSCSCRIAAPPSLPVAVVPIVTLVSTARGPDPAPVPKPKRPTVKGWKSKKQRLRHCDTQ
ncbi:MAG: TIGR02996 domain-containing protein [Gemmataceae bacterium]